MPSVVVRVWVPDRPGALGQVASRIGAVRGDVTGIEILERGTGLAVDELVVALPDDVPLELLAAEIAQVDGVQVEDVRVIDDPDRDPALLALEAAARLVAARDDAALMASLCADAASALDAAWAVVVDGADGTCVASIGEHPSVGWIAAFVDGVRHAGYAPDDVAWAECGPDRHVVVGRPGRTLRARERRLLEGLASVAAVQRSQLRARSTARNQVA